MRPRPRRPLSAALTSAATGCVLLSGCGDAGELRSAGPTPTATGPVRLWPDLPPVTAPPYDYGETDTAPVPGVRVPAGGVRALDPVAVVRAEALAYPEAYALPDGAGDSLAKKLAGCAGRGPGQAQPSKPSACPVLRAYHRDLTGDGREELIVAVRMGRQITEVRCYMPARGSDPAELTRIMSTADQLVDVQLAGRDIILRSVSAGMPGSEYRTSWSWDEQHRAMLPTRDEIVPVKPGKADGTGKASRGASASPGGAEDAS
ncbi:hypothetical protein [Streptomyces sp. NPDC047315]|uniref:hypothetical protein n=1 Tax=Streptomyces sp. NPDC047315 TaxID=3155142 RepID=UPI00340207F0